MAQGNKIPPLLDGSWDWLTPEGAQEAQDRTAEQAEEALELARKFYRTFGTIDGREVLAYLKDFAYNSPGFNPELGMDMGVAMGFAREGQRAMVRFIELMVERVDKADSEEG